MKTFQKKNAKTLSEVKTKQNKFSCLGSERFLVKTKVQVFFPVEFFGECEELSQQTFLKTRESLVNL